MVELHLGNQTVEAVRTTLRPREVARVLGTSESAVRNMMRRGALTDASSGRSRRVDPAEVAKLVADRPLALELLGDIVSGRLDDTRDDPPVADLSMSDRTAADES